MESNSLWGSLLPVWILGAPLIGAIFEWMRTPKVRTHGRDDDLPAGGGNYRAEAPQPPATGFGRDSLAAASTRR